MIFNILIQSSDKLRTFFDVQQASRMLPDLLLNERISTTDHTKQSSRDDLTGINSLKVNFSNLSMFYFNCY